MLNAPGCQQARLLGKALSCYILKWHVLKLNLSLFFSRFEIVTPLLGHIHIFLSNSVLRLPS
jgi:hypothetical protein